MAAQRRRQLCLVACHNYYTCLLLLLSGERIMKLAEELYQAGFISYPRTETDVYDPGMDLRVRSRAGHGRHTCDNTGLAMY